MFVKCFTSKVIADNQLWLFTCGLGWNCYEQSLLTIKRSQSYRSSSVAGFFFEKLSDLRQSGQNPFARGRPLPCRYNETHVYAIA